MKNIKDIVPSVEVCKEMQDAGIDFGGTVFTWMSDRRGYGMWELIHSSLLETDFDKTDREFIPAPVTDEMWDIIPDSINGAGTIAIKTTKDSFKTGKYDVKLVTGICEKNNGFIAENNKFLPEALSKLCLWVKKEGHK